MQNPQDFSQTVVAPAKINLGLEILGKRPDGYHDVNSIFYRINEPHDILHVEAADGFSFMSTDESLPLDERNLVVKAVKRFAESLELPMPDLHFHLAKHIPSGAGLGGGSSDAAAALMICNAYSGEKLTQIELLHVAKSVGADVPFFLSRSKAAIVRGIGDEILPIDLEIPFSILIAKLGDVNVNTKKAYERIRLGSERIPTPYSELFHGPLDIVKAKKYLRNDFEPSIFAKYPAVARLKREIIDLGAAFASMSGSGSAVFGLFEDSGLARKALNQLNYEGISAFLA